MTNENKSDTPINESNPMGIDQDIWDKFTQQPLQWVYSEYKPTQREYFAAKFTAAQIQGIVAASGNTAHGWSDSDFAKAGIAIADALILELKK